MVTDQNDNAPRFIFPNQANVTIETSFRNSAHTTVAELQASDSDEGANAELLYSLLGGNQGGRFELDPHSGRLSLARDLGAADAGVHALLLSVRDQGVPPMSAEVELRIALRDLPADPAPQLPPQGPHSLAPTQLQPPGGSAAGASAVDRGRQRRPTTDDGGEADGGSGGLSRRGLLLVGCLAVPAVVLAIVCLAVLVLARLRLRSGGAGGGGSGGRTPAVASASYHRSNKLDIRLIGGPTPQPNAESPSMAARQTQPQLHIGAAGDMPEAFKHSPTLPLPLSTVPTAGEAQRTQTLMRLVSGGHDGGNNTYYRIPTSDESSYDHGGCYIPVVEEAATALRQGRRCRSIGQQPSQKHQQQAPAPAYQVLMQQPSLLAEAAGSAPVATAAPTMGRGSGGGDGSRRQFNLITSSFV